MEENICKPHSDKGLISKNIRNSKLNSKTTDNLITKWAMELNRHSFKEDREMVNRHVKRSSALLIIRETQIKTTLRDCLTPARMAIMKKTRDNNFSGGCGERRNLCTAGGNVNWYRQHYGTYHIFHTVGKQYGSSSNH